MLALALYTGNGLQGFQTPIEEDSFIVDEMGALGNVHSERGLTYFEVALSGHMYVFRLVLGVLDHDMFCRVPQFSPRAAFQIMQYLMGFRDTP